MASTTSTTPHPIRIAIIGSGPSAFYAAEALLAQKDCSPIEIDMFDRLPTPHGLVRGGVAPDHQKIKSVTAVYDKIAANPHMRFFGNVDYGRDITLVDLTQHYHQIVYAVGAQTDKHLGIAGEHLLGSHPATDFVGWYNGHPDYRALQFDFNTDTAVVIGVGNVAIDVARILARRPQDLYPTDIADNALAALRDSKIKNIYILGRRGIIQAAFTNKEFAELGQLEDVQVVALAQDAELDPISEKELAHTTERNTARNLETLRKYVTQDTTVPAKSKTIHLRFLTAPTELLGTQRVQGVRVVRNKLVEDENGRVSAVATEHTEVIPAGLVFRSVGYRGVALPDVPFRSDWGTIPNILGRVTQFTDGKPQGKLGDVVVGQYVTGWSKRGPSGVIGDNRKDSQETVAQMLADIKSHTILTPTTTGRDAIVDLLNARDIFFVTYEDWRRLDEVERKQGQATNRVRSKFTTTQEMIATIKKLRASQPD